MTVDSENETDVEGTQVGLPAIMMIIIMVYSRLDSEPV